jgi:DNA-binding MarR family transcriptional regulator
MTVCEDEDRSPGGVLGPWAGTISQADYEALALFRREVRAFMAFSQRTLEAEGVTPHQYQAMLAIQARGDRDMAIGDLAEELHISIQSAVELVGRMKQAGFVERTRSRKDLRRILLTLAPAGRQVLPRLAGLHLAQQRANASKFAAALHRFQSIGDAWAA